MFTNDTESLERHEEYVDICAAASIGNASPGEMAKLGVHLHTCGYCCRKLHDFVEFSAVFFWKGFEAYEAGRSGKEEPVYGNSYEEFEKESQKLSVKVFMHVWGATMHGKGMFTLGCFRKKTKNRRRRMLVTDDDGEVNTTSTFARIERSNKVARATGKAFLFSYTCSGAGSSRHLPLIVKPA